MNPDHHAKTLAALDAAIASCESQMLCALERLKERRKAFADLLAPNGITYYRAHTFGPFPSDENLNFVQAMKAQEVFEHWLIVSGHHLTTEIHHRDRTYYSMGVEGPGPDQQDILRVRPVAVDIAENYDCGEDIIHTVYFLLVEELP